MNKENETLNAIQKHLEFTQAEAEQFMENPRNQDILPKIGNLINTVLTFKVIEAKGCGCQHRVGQEIRVRGDGIILSENESEGPCVYLIQALVPVVYGAQEFIYAGLNPEDLRFKQVGCFDVGLSCGGIGNVVVELEVKKT